MISLFERLNEIDSKNLMYRCLIKHSDRYFKEQSIKHAREIVNKSAANIKKHDEEVSMAVE